MTSRKTEYQAKVTVDTGLIRGRVPAPLLKVMGARPGDYLERLTKTVGAGLVPARDVRYRLD